jgi:cell division protease FtsH
MVTEWGMSDKLGRVRYNGNEQEVFLGHSVTQTKNLSDQTAKLIDEAVRDLIQTGEATAKKILLKHRAELHAVSKALLEFETLSGEEVKKIMAGGTIDRDDDLAKKKAASKPSSTVPRAGGAKRGRSGSEDMEPQPQS